MFIRSANRLIYAAVVGTTLLSASSLSAQEPASLPRAGSLLSESLEEPSFSIQQVAHQNQIPLAPPVSSGIGTGATTQGETLAQGQLPAPAPAPNTTLQQGTGLPGPETPTSGNDVGTSQPAVSVPPTVQAPSKKGPPAPPFKPLFFDNNWDPYTNSDDLYLFGEELKNLEFGDMTISSGGQIRHRYMDEFNRLRPGGPGDVVYDLWRLRQYVNIEFKDLLRIYVEGIDASQFDEGVGRQTGIDVNRWDIQNAFVDAVLLSEQVDLVFRAGRQELLYGAQRLVSPLDWSNTRRNFTGFKFMYAQEDWKVDAFATRPVNTATGRPTVNFDNERDEADYSRTFSGVYSTYTGFERMNVDSYWLWLRGERENPARADGSRHTVGARLYGAEKVGAGTLKYDIEGAFQFGHDGLIRPVPGADPNGSDVVAGFAVGQIDYQLTEVDWKPTLRAYIWWASGDDDPNDGKNNTFSQLFPLGHAYWGIIDNLSGQNLINYSVQGIVSPTKKLSLVGAWHYFDRASRNDFVYNVAGVPIGGDVTEKNIGQEVDLIATYKFNPNFNVQIGYSWFWYGDYITQGPANRADANQLYVQTSLQY